MDCLKTCSGSSGRVVFRWVERETLVWLTLILFIILAFFSGDLIAKNVARTKDLEFYTYKYDCRVRITQFLEYPPSGNNNTNEIRNVVTCRQRVHSEGEGWEVGAPTELPPAEQAFVIIGWMVIVWAILILVFGKD